MTSTSRFISHFCVAFAVLISGSAVIAQAREAVSISKSTRLYTTKEGSRVIRSLDPGARLYPTGNKNGLMWEVEDESGNKGWVFSSLITR